MAKLTREDFLTRIQARLGEDSSDEALAFLEDMTDTFDGLTESTSNDGEDWKAKYTELDESWKKRYKERFFHSSSKEEQKEFEQDQEQEQEKEPQTVNDLFSESEVK